MATLAPISYASSIIGFISFTISLLTLLRVVWGSLSTLTDAPTQVHFSFANLKQALYEERSAVHRATRLANRRRDSRRYSGSGADHDHDPAGKKYAREGAEGPAGLKVMQDTVRQLCRTFRRLERPFLRPGLGAGPAAGRDGDAEKAERWDAEVERFRYREEGFFGDYCDMTLGRRFAWLRCKSEVDGLWISLERLQVRRMAREVTEALGDLHSLRGSMGELRMVQEPTRARSRVGSRSRLGSRRRQSSREREREQDMTEQMHVRRSYPDR